LIPTRSDARRRAALLAALAALWALATASRLFAQLPAESRARCQLLSFRVLQADKGGLTDGRFAQGFDETAQRAALHTALAALPQLDMIALGADTALVRRSDLATRIAARAFVTRADVERVDKALTAEFLVSTTVMLEFLNAASGEVYYIQALTGSTNIRKDAGADLTPVEATQAFATTLAGTVRELAGRIRERYRPGIRVPVIQQLADGRLALGAGLASGLREGARLEVRDSSGQLVGIVRVEQAQRAFAVTGRPLADNPGRPWVGLTASSAGLNRTAGQGAFAHMVMSVEQRSELVQPAYLLPQATLIYWLHESLAEAAPGLNMLPPVAAGGLAGDQDVMEIATGRAGDIAGQRVIPDFVVRSSISRADALSEVGPDGATYYILKVGLDVSFNDVRTGQVFYATYVEGTQQERVRAGERSLDLAVSYRNLLQRTMADVGRRVAAEYAPVNAEGTVREVRADGSLALTVTGTGALPSGGIVTLWAEGEEIRDPRSRAVLGRVQEAAARIRVVRQSGPAADALTIGPPARPLAGARFVAPATVGDAGRQLVQVQRVEVREGVAVPGALLEEIVQSALTSSRRFAVLPGPEVLADLAALREREFGGGGFSNQAAQRLLNVENAQPSLYARVVARFLAPVPAQEHGQPAQGYEARIGVFLVSAADTTQPALSGAQSLQSRFALPRGGRREVVVGLSAQDVAKIYAGMSRELARTVVEQLAVTGH
jgi:hypothetical protein